MTDPVQLNNLPVKAGYSMVQHQEGGKLTRKEQKARAEIEQVFAAQGLAAVYDARDIGFRAGNAETLLREVQHLQYQNIVGQGLIGQAALLAAQQGGPVLAEGLIKSVQGFQGLCDDIVAEFGVSTAKRLFRQD